MKRFLSIFLMAILIFTLSACGGGGDEKENEGSVAVDEGLLKVEITLPADFFDGETDVDIKAAADEQGFSKCVVNENGSVTYTMTKAKRNEILKEMEASFEESADELINDTEDGPSSFTEITHNKGFKLIEMKANENYGGFDGLAMYSMIMMGAYYQLFDGVNPDELDITVRVIDKDSGEELASLSAEELRNMSEEEDAEEDAADQ